MNCPRCDSPTKVLRSTPGAAVVKRRRACPNCGFRFSTTELTNDSTHGLDARVRRVLRETEQQLNELTSR